MTIILFVGTIVIYGTVILHILHTKHEYGDEAMMWLLAVLLMPGVGILFYLFFGITRLHQTDIKFKEITKNEANRRRKLPSAVTQWEQLANFTPENDLMNNRFNVPLNHRFPRRIALSGNKVELLRDGVMAYPRMLADIAGAKQCIRLESFIIMNDEVGRKFLSLLKSKAAEGVDVKILFDSFGSFFLMMRHLFGHFRTPQKNFSMLAFSPMNILTPWKVQLRNHRKLLIVDGHIAYCGGINIAAENEHLKSVPKHRYIHDLHCRISGPAVAYCTRLFLRDWAYTMRRHRITSYAVPGDFPDVEGCGNTVLRMVDSGPGDNFRGSEKLFFTAAATCRSSLYIITPYFVPGSAYIEALIMAASRGVDVRVIVPKENNHHFVDWASRSFYDTLLNGGVRIFERHGIFSHTKALLADNEWGFMGSSNCDNRSFRLNFELDFCFEAGEFVGEMSKQFAWEFSQCRELTIHQLRRGYLYELRGQLSALLAPIL